MGESWRQGTDGTVNLVPNKRGIMPNGDADRLLERLKAVAREREVPLLKTPADENAADVQRFERDVADRGSMLRPRRDRHHRRRAGRGDGAGPLPRPGQGDATYLPRYSRDPGGDRGIG